MGGSAQARSGARKWQRVALGILPRLGPPARSGPTPGHSRTQIMRVLDSSIMEVGTVCFALCPEPGMETNRAGNDRRRRRRFGPPAESGPTPGHSRTQRMCVLDSSTWRQGQAVFALVLSPEMETNRLGMLPRIGPPAKSEPTPRHVQHSVV